MPQAASPAVVGTLVLTFGETRVEFPDCKLDYGTVERTAGGLICRLALLDHRWRWRFGQISGTYNVRRDDSQLQKNADDADNSERTPQQLATLCLEAMGETQFDVGDLPNESRPSVEWDCVVPADALAALCDQLGCRVVLQLNNRVALRRAGVGAGSARRHSARGRSHVELAESAPMRSRCGVA